MSTFSWSMIKARALLCAMLCVPLLVSAAEFVVTTTADLVDTKLSDGLCGTELVQGCSLRAALQQANSLPGEDVIILGSNVYELSLSGRGEDEASAGDLDVTDHVIIRGDGNTVIDAKGQDRIFDVHAPDGSGLRFTLQGITLTGGNSFNEPGGAIYLRAIDNEKHLASDVLLEDLVLRLNDAGSSHGGGLAVADRSNGWVTLRRVTLEENQARNGGAVHLVRNVEMVDSLIRLNSASEGGGGIFQASSDKPASRLILRKSKVLNNSGSRDGGGIHSLGDLEVREGSEVRGNKVSGIAFISGGGIFSSSASNLFVTQTIISDNEAKGVGSRGGGVYFSNETEQMGELYDVEVGGNKAAYGAGIYGKNLRVLRHVYVHDNLAELAGGGLYLKTESPVVTSIEHSVVDANVSRRVFGAAFGGGIYYDGTGDSASLSLRNSTVSRNVAEGIGEGATGYGGGLFVTTGGSASANLTSFVDNGSTSGGHHVVNLSEINVTQSLFAGPESTLLDCLSLPTISFGHNIDRDASCVNHETDLSLSRVEMKIAELPSMNGDYRQIYTLAPESPAVDAIPADVCVASVDQRHFSRSGGCDVGAYEVDAVAVNAGSIAFADDSKHLEVEENAGKVVLRVLRQGGSEGELRVAYRSYERTARGDVTIPSSAAIDFYHVNGTLLWADGDDSEKSIEIFLKDDMDLEGAETFSLELMAPTMAEPWPVRPVAQVTLRDDEIPRGEIQFAQSNPVMVEESDEQVVLVVERTPVALGATRVGYRVLPSSATLGMDFRLVEAEKGAFVGELEFAEGEARKALVIDLMDDRVYEGGEQIKLQLYAVKGEGDHSLGWINRWDILLTDDETPESSEGVFSFARKEFTFNEGDGQVRLPVTRENGRAGRVVLDYEVIAGSAASRDDYLLDSGQLAFANDVGSLDIELTILEDTEIEGEESLELHLYDSMDRLLSSATVTIEDNDVPKPPLNHGEISFYESTKTVFEGAGFIDLFVVRAKGSDGLITVDYEVTGGTALADKDYILAKGVLTFPERALQRSITLEVLSDNIAEPAEYIEISLFDASGGARIVTPSKMIVGVLDVPASKSTSESESENETELDNDKNEKKGFLGAAHPVPLAVLLLVLFIQRSRRTGKRYY